MAWLGVAGLLILVMVALCANDVVQRRLGHSAWKWVQQFAYTGFIFIALHVLLMKFGGKMKISPGLSPLAVPWLGLVVLLQGLGFLYTVRRDRNRAGN